MAGTAGFAVVELVLVLLVVLELLLSVESIGLDVLYPVSKNFSVVNLTCTDGFGGVIPTGQRPATFLRNGEEITPTSTVVTSVMGINDFSILFVFNQDQEGNFTCKTSGSEVSSVEKLAGSYVE